MEWGATTARPDSVTVSGTAPDEATRLRAIEIARQVASPERVTDTTTAEAPDPLEPPDFALELLRNEAEVSLIGLVPGTEARAVIHEALAAGALDGLVTDCTQHEPSARFPGVADEGVWPLVRARPLEPKGGGPRRLQRAPALLSSSLGGRGARPRPHTARLSTAGVKA